MKYNIRSATAEDGSAMIALLPRLAAFEIPSHREARHLWESDQVLLETWLAGEAEHCQVHVAVDEADRVIGLTLTSLGSELLSREPSAHLEAIVVSETSQGVGVGEALLSNAEAAAKGGGALSLTLNVFATNRRARNLYERLGYTGELIRHIKVL